MIDDQVALVVNSAGRDEVRSNNYVYFVIGVTLSAMCTGQHPFRTNYGRPAEMISIGETTERSKERDLSGICIHSPIDP